MPPRLINAGRALGEGRGGPCGTSAAEEQGGSPVGAAYSRGGYGDTSRGVPRHRQRDWDRASAPVP